MKGTKFFSMLCISCCMTTILHGTAHALMNVNIDFDSHSPLLDSGNPIIEKDIKFNFNAAAWGILSPLSGACCNVNYNGTPALFADGDYGNLAGGANANVVLTTNSFWYINKLSSFDASTYWTGAYGKLDVIGHFYNGSTVSVSFDINSNWQHFVLPDTFVKLVSVEFRDSQSGAFLSAPGFGIDNIALVVPEPSTYAMLLAGLGLLGFSLRGQKK